MNNIEHLQATLNVLEEKYGEDILYDFFSAFYDVIVLGHDSSLEDNPHLSSELPCHPMYEAGSKAAEMLLSKLQAVQKN